MAEGQEQEDKTEDPSGRKLEQARQKGDAPRTQDLPTVMSLAAGAGVIFYGSASLTPHMLGSLRGFWGHAGEIHLDGPTVIGLIPYLGKAILPFLAAVVAASMAAAIFGNIIQTPPVFTNEKLKPDLSRLNPFAGLKRMFSKEGLVQFLKNLVKMGIVTWALVAAAVPVVARMQEFAQMEVGQLIAIMRDLAIALLLAALIAYAAIALLDYVHQRFAFMARMRMSKEEVKEEHKNLEGDPHVKARLRQIRMEKSRRRMMQRVPEATVVITNPTHYAIALKYDQDESEAPICVAKGVDSLALKIRKVAEDADVPVIEDPPLARALYATVEIDDMIPTEHYKAVAKIIGLIYRKKSVYQR